LHISLCIWALSHILYINNFYEIEKIIIKTNFLIYNVIIIIVYYFYRYRGKLLSYNELQSDDTRIELIDIGSIHQTKLKNLLVLPYYLKYEPLVSKIFFLTSFII